MTASILIRIAAKLRRIVRACASLKAPVSAVAFSAALAGAAFAFASPALAHWTDAGNKCVKYDCEGDVMVNTCRSPVQVMYGCGDGKRCGPVGNKLNTGDVGRGDSSVKDIGDLRDSIWSSGDVWGGVWGEDGEIYWTRDILSPGESKNITRPKSGSGALLVGYASVVPDDGSVYSVDGHVETPYGAVFRHTHEDGGVKHISGSIYPHFQCMAPVPVPLRALRGTPPPGEKLWDPREREEGGKGRTHLHIAAAAGDYEAARWLIANGARVDAHENKRNTRFVDPPLEHALNYINSSIREDIVAAHMAALLLENGATSQWRISSLSGNPHGDQPLHHAAREDWPYTASILLKHGAKVNVDGLYDETPLHRAALVDSLATAMLLLENGAKVNAKSGKGGTPLHWAAGRAALSTAMLLLENGANINAKDEKGRTPLDRAIQTDSVVGYGDVEEQKAKMQSLLRQHNARCNTTC